MKSLPANKTSVRPQQWKVSTAAGFVRVDVAGQTIEISPKTAESFALELLKTALQVVDPPISPWVPTFADIVKKIVKENERCDCGQRLLCSCGRYIDLHTKLSNCARIGICLDCDQ